MKAFIHHGAQGLAGTSYTEMEERQPGRGEVKVRLKTAGLNHRDLFVPYRRKPEDPPVILGSDGAGVIEGVGPDVHHVRLGDEVMINPTLGWPTKSAAPPKGYEILGHPDHGTFAEYIVISAENVEQKPEALTWEEAGVLPLAALTAYRALFTRAKVQPGQTVLIPGIGSGVATFMLQMAKAVGAHVYVTSRSEFKRKKAEELGADKTIDSHDDWNASLQGEKVDIVIESVGAATFEKSLRQLRPGGTLVTFGATAGEEIKLNIRSFFYGQYNMLGTTMGSTEEFREMLDFIKKHRIKPIIDKMYPLAETLDALKRLDKGEQFGKIGLYIE